MVWNGSHFSRAPECGVPDKCEEFLQRYLFFLNYDVSKPITVQCDESQSCLRAAIAARCLACLLCFSSPRWHRILLCTNQEKRCLPSLGHVTSPTNTSTGKTFCGIHAHKTVGYENIFQLNSWNEMFLWTNCCRCWYQGTYCVIKQGWQVFPHSKNDQLWACNCSACGFTIFSVKC